MLVKTPLPQPDISAVTRRLRDYNAQYSKLVRDDVYQGHNADGSGIQNHSCGGLYPAVIGDYENGDAFLIHPKLDREIRMPSRKRCEDVALALKAGYITAANNLIHCNEVKPDAIAWPVLEN